MALCKIKKITQLSSNKNNPIIAHFENGDFLPNDGAKSLECFYAENTDDANSRQTIATSEDNVYYGKIGHGFPTNLVRTFVAIRNKSSNKIRLVEVEQCSMLVHHLDDRANSMKAKTKEDASRELIKAFGGKTTIKILNRNDRKNFNVDSMANQLNETRDELAKNKEQPDDEFEKGKIKRNQFMESMFPKYNVNATNLQDVYELTDLIDKGLMLRLHEEAIQVLQCDDVSEIFKTPYIVNIVKIVQKSKEPDSAVNLDKVKVCIYIDALINFLNGLKQKNKKMKIAPFSDITTKVETDIRSKFAQPHDKKLLNSKFTETKATCYTIILSLLLSDSYEINMDDIIEALRTSKKDLLHMFANIAVCYKDRQNIITLQLPSKLPPPKISFNRKRRTF